LWRKNEFGPTNGPSETISPITDGDEPVPQRAADLVLPCHPSFRCLGVGSVSEIYEPGRGLRDERDPPSDQAIARLGLPGLGHAVTTTVPLAI
jgi:hypothetical protein